MPSIMLSRTPFNIMSIATPSLSLYATIFLIGSGSGKPKGEGSRQLKLQGSSKIGQQCTAHIKVTQTCNGELNVQYCNYHIHDTRFVLRTAVHSVN